MCFVKFCQLILESDDETGYCCELVQDFLKEQGGSKKVEEILNKKMQEIRGADVLIAGLCHPCPEMRSLVLSEMQQFRVPPRPFADGTSLTLKNIAASSTCVWYRRAASFCRSRRLLRWGIALAGIELRQYSGCSKCYSLNQKCSRMSTLLLSGLLGRC